MPPLPPITSHTLPMRIHMKENNSGNLEGQIEQREKRKNEKRRRLVGREREGDNERTVEERGGEKREK